MNISRLKINKKIIIESAILLIAFLMLCSGNVAGTRPLGYGLYMAVCLAGGACGVGSILFAVTGALVGWSWQALIVAPSLSAWGWLVSFALRKLKLKCQYRILITLLANFPLYGLLLWLLGATPLGVLLSVTFALISGGFMMFAMPVLGGNRNITTINSAGLAALCFAAFIGLDSINIMVFRFAPVAFAAVVLFVGYISGPYAATAAGFLAGLGVAVSSADITLLAVYAVSAVAAAAFSKGYRVLSPIALALTHVMCVYYFSVHYDEVLWSLLALLVPSVLYAALPKRFMEGMRDYFKPNNVLSIMEISGGMGRLLPEKVRYISEAFSDMGTYLAEVGMITNSAEKEGEIICAKLMHYCESCPKQSACPLGLEFSSGRTRQRNKASLSDAVVSVGCIYGGQVLKSANETMGRIESQTSAAAAERKAMNAYGNRLLTLSHMLVEASKSVAAEYRYNQKMSRTLASDLREGGMIVSDAFVTEQFTGIAVTPQDAKRLDMNSALTRCLKLKMRVVEEIDFDKGWKAVRFAPAPVYDIVYAFSGKAKANTSGDEYSALACGNRILLSLCDGKGSGEGAAALSNATLSVIEDYYKAGFDAVETVSCVNSLLAASSGEDFSALDVVSVDLTTLTADIIKAGSPPTYIIKKDSILRIDGSALPVGALDAARPALSRQVLEKGDMIVIISDGISDSLPNLDELLSGAQTINAKKLADDILSRAAATLARDDMSVLTARIVATNT